MNILIERRSGLQSWVPFMGFMQIKNDEKLNVQKQNHSIKCRIIV